MPSSVLLVEGKDDQQVIYHLCNSYGIDNRTLFEVVEKGGIDSLKADLSVRPRIPQSTVGAVLDADDDIAGRWQSIFDIVTGLGYSDMPSSPPPDGLVLNGTDDLARLGIWIMPDNRVKGILEDFIARLVDDEDALLQHAIDAVASIALEKRQFPTVRESKAVIHTWLAWQEEPGTPLGQAITKTYLRADADLARLFMGWVKRLFEV